MSIRRQCPPRYLLDSGRECGGDEYEVVLTTTTRGDGDDDGGRKRRIGLHATDLHNGIYLLQLLPWKKAMEALRLEGGRHVVTLLNQYLLSVKASLYFLYILD